MSIDNRSNPAAGRKIKQKRPITPVDVYIPYLYHYNTEYLYNTLGSRGTFL